MSIALCSIAVQFQGESDSNSWYHLIRLLLQRNNISISLSLLQIEQTRLLQLLLTSPFPSSPVTLVAFALLAPVSQGLYFWCSGAQAWTPGSRYSLDSADWEGNHHLPGPAGSIPAGTGQSRAGCSVQPCGLPAVLAARDTAHSSLQAAHQAFS